MKIRLFLSLWFLLSSAAEILAAELHLLMFEKHGCVYCAEWNEKIGPQYPLTSEGKVAPLLRLQLGEPLPEWITLKSNPVFTPTFILVNGGIETGRITGYPGQDFFFPMLAKLINEEK